MDWEIPEFIVSVLAFLLLLRSGVQAICETRERICRLTSVPATGAKTLLYAMTVVDQSAILPFLIAF